MSSSKRERRTSAAHHGSSGAVDVADPPVAVLCCSVDEEERKERARRQFVGRGVAVFVAIALSAAIALAQGNDPSFVAVVTLASFLVAAAMFYSAWQLALRLVEKSRAKPPPSVADQANEDWFRQSMRRVLPFIGVGILVAFYGPFVDDSDAFVITGCCSCICHRSWLRWPALSDVAVPEACGDRSIRQIGGLPRLWLTVVVTDHAAA